MCVCVCVYGIGTLLQHDKTDDAVNILCFMAKRDRFKISGLAESTNGRNIGSTKNMWKEREKRKGLLGVY